VDASAVVRRSKLRVELSADLAATLPNFEKERAHFQNAAESYFYRDGLNTMNNQSLAASMKNTVSFLSPRRDS
jgi:hypothetical protein